MAKSKLQTVLENLEKIFTSLKSEEHYNPEEIKEAMDLAEVTVKNGQAAKKQIQFYLSNHHHKLTKHLFSIKGTDTGTVTQFLGPKHELSINKKKKVEWDQDFLKYLNESDENAASIIRTAYSVRETDYGKLDPRLRDKLDGGRTVKDADPTFTIKER